MESKKMYTDGLVSIVKYYGDKTAKRSGVKLINHIYDGLTVLTSIKADRYAMEAFCFHPMFQSDEELGNNHLMIAGIDPNIVALIFEYRSVANAFNKSMVYTTKVKDIRISPIQQVNEMLVADKVQNRKDFLAHGKGKLEDSDRLDLYFQMWMDKFEITEEIFTSLCNNIDKFHDSVVGFANDHVYG
jgi:hypothetical protein